MFYLHFYKTHGHQVLQGCDLQYGSSTDKAKRLFGHMNTHYHVAN